jgi:hypothetical protein
VAAALVRALQSTLQAQPPSSGGGGAAAAPAAAPGLKGQQFCAALSPLALALVYEGATCSSDEDAVSSELVKGLLLHAQAAAAGTGGAHPLLSLLLPLSAALLLAPATSGALKTVLARAVLHLAQACPDAFRAQVRHPRWPAWEVAAALADSERAVEL